MRKGRAFCQKCTLNNSFIGVYDHIGYARQSFLGIIFEIPVMLQVFVPEFFNLIL